MALNVGELVARMRLDQSEMEAGQEEAQGSFKAFGGKIEALALAAGAAAAVALGAALVGALNQQQVGGKIAAQFGETSKEAGYWGKLAGEIYADNFGASVTEVGDAIGAIRKQNLIDGNMTAEEVKKITESALTLSDAFGYGVAESSRAAQQMIMNGLVPSAEEAFDVIAFGAQHGIDKSEDLLDTFNEYSTKFRDLGIDAKQALGLMSQGLQGGARDADTVADSLKEFAIRARDGSKTSATAYKALGLDAEKMTAKMAKGGKGASDGLQIVLDRLRAMKDPVAREAAAVGLFGTKAEDLGKALFSLDPKTATDGMDKLAGSTARAGEAMYNNAGANLETFKRKLTEGFVSVIGGKVVPALTSMSEWLLKLGGFYKENQAWLEPLVVGLGTFAGAIIAIVYAQKLWMATTAAVKGAWMALNASFAGSPIGLIIVAVLALVAVFIYLWTHCEGFRNFWIGLWDGIKSVALAIAHWFAGPFARFFVRVWNGLKSGVSAMVNFFKTRWNLFTATLESVKTRVGKIFSAIGGFISGSFRSAVSIVKGAINGMIGVVNGAIGGLNKMIGLANKIPGVHVPHIPTIPKLAKGGIVSPTPGGRPVIMGDGSEVEIGLPLSKLRALVGLSGGGSASTGGTHVLELRLVSAGRAIRRMIRLEGSDLGTLGLEI